MIVDVSQAIADQQRGRIEYSMTSEEIGNRRRRVSTGYELQTIETMIASNQTRLWEETLPEDDNPLNRAKEQRQELLFRKYAANGKLESDSEARLRILTARIEQLSPLLTEGEVQQFSQITHSLAAIRKRNDRRQRMYAILLSFFKTHKD